jgi:signal transduction histidine kinase
VHRRRTTIATGGTLALLTTLRPGEIVLGPDNPVAPGPNPAGISILADIEARLFKPINGLYLAIVVAAAGAPIWRWRRSRRDERQQLKVLAYVGAWIIALQILAYATPLSRLLQAANILWALSFAGLVIGLPAAAAIAVLRYHLYDIDLVINKTLLFAALAAFVTTAYVVIVAGAGAMIRSAGQSNLALSILATAVVAVAFQPVRERAQALANRLVYGRRSAPHEVSLPADGDGGRVELWRAPPDAHAAARRGRHRRERGRDLPERGRQASPDSPLAGGARRPGRTPIPDQAPRRGDRPADRGRAIPVADGTAERLLIDVAGQAGLLVRNLRLTADLQARVDELAESRLRIVSAQDAERRRLERDIHDGVQQHVVALMAKLQLARNQVRRKSDLSAETLEEVQADAGRLLDELRELASGIHPTVLTDGGVVAAVRFRADRLPIKVVLDADSTSRTRRYPGPIEAAGYFIACEALANVLKHADASRATVSISADNGTLTIKVADDGKGFRPLDNRSLRPSWPAGPCRGPRRPVGGDGRYWRGDDPLRLPACPWLNSFG